MANSNLHSAKRAKNDEFYTQLSDIEQEVKYYWSKVDEKDEVNPFRDKVVFLNCDDPQHSNFWVYFARQFDHLGIKELISTHYRADGGSSYMMIMDRDEDGNPINYGMGDKNTPRGKKIPLQGDGDFRSDECVELLKRSDIVVTNPPFSLFREYVAQLMEYEKKFLIIGNMNAITYKEIFPLIKENKLWLGMRSLSKEMLFGLTDDYAKEVVETKREGSAWRKVDGVVYGRLASACWFTNLDHKKRHEKMILVQQYAKKPWEYPTYDNYNAIEVSQVKMIPCDYDGVMGVPITFLDKYNPEQFEIVDANDHRLPHFTKIKPHGLVKDADGSIKGKPKYARILIKRK